MNHVPSVQPGTKKKGPVSDYSGSDLVKRRPGGTQFNPIKRDTDDNNWSTLIDLWSFSSSPRTRRELLLYDIVRPFKAISTSSSRKRKPWVFAFGVTYISRAASMMR